MVPLTGVDQTMNNKNIDIKHHINKLYKISKCIEVYEGASPLSQHLAESSVNFAFWEEIRKFCLGFTMVVYENIFGSINK